MATAVKIVLVDAETNEELKEEWYECEEQEDAEKMYDKLVNIVWNVGSEDGIPKEEVS